MLETLGKGDSYHVSMEGEFFVLAKLAQLKYAAALTYGHAKKVDVIATSKSGKMFKVEVKTTREEIARCGSQKSMYGENYEWPMSKKHEEIKDRNIFYCFVLLPRDFNKTPRFFLVRSYEVASYVKEQHELWKKYRKRKSEKELDIRIFRIGLKPYSTGLNPIENYENAWHTLPK